MSALSKGLAVGLVAGRSDHTSAKRNGDRDLSPSPSESARVPHDFRPREVWRPMPMSFAQVFACGVLAGVFALYVLSLWVNAGGAR